MLTLAESPSSGSGQRESRDLAESPETLADLCRRVAALEVLLGRGDALESRLARKRPDSTGRLRTRRDKTPYGWRARSPSSLSLVEDGPEQRMIQRIVEMAQLLDHVGLRGMCRVLDEQGHRRRGGKNWTGAHGLVKSILKREGVFSPADAKARVLERIAAAQARAADR